MTVLNTKQKKVRDEMETAGFPWDQQLGRRKAVAWMRINHDPDWGRRAEDVAVVIRWAKEQAHSVSGTGDGNRSSKPPSGTSSGK